MNFPRQIKNRTLRLLALTVTLGLSAALIFSAYGGMMNPLKSSAGALAAMLIPFFIVMQLIVLVIDLVWFRKSAIVAAAALLVCAGPIPILSAASFPSICAIDRETTRKCGQGHDIQYVES